MPLVPVANKRRLKQARAEVTRVGGMSAVAQASGLWSPLADCVSKPTDWQSPEISRMVPNQVISAYLLSFRIVPPRASCPNLPVQRPVLDGLRDVISGEAVRPRQIRDGPCRLEDAAVGAGPEALVGHGQSGLQPGDWVMQGPRSPMNYLLSGKYQWPWVPTFGQAANIPASYMSGVTYNVPPSSLSWPSGLLGAVKGAMGQRIYLPSIMVDR